MKKSSGECPNALLLHLGGNHITLIDQQDLGASTNGTFISVVVRGINQFMFLLKMESWTDGMTK